MATKTKKSNVSKSANKPMSLKLKIWFGVLLVAVVAAVGIAIVRYSHAGTSVTYSASQMSSLPGFSIDGAKLAHQNTGKGNILVYMLPTANSQIYAKLQLFPGNYVLCTYGNGGDTNSGTVGVTIRKFTGGPAAQSFSNTTSSFSPTNGSICVAFNTIGASGADFFIKQLSFNKTAYITGVSIEAR